jgi:hypothetical protein
MSEPEFKMYSHDCLTDTTIIRDLTPEEIAELPEPSERIGP